MGRATLCRWARATKLLVLPFLFYHFERSTRGMWVFIAFLVVLHAVDGRRPGSSRSIPSLTLKARREHADRGIFVKNYIDQSQEFLLCTVVLAYPDHYAAARRKNPAGASADAVAANFVVNMVFVVVSRTALVTLPVMLAVFAMAHLKWRTNVALFCARRSYSVRWPGRCRLSCGDDGQRSHGTTGLQGIQPADIDRAAARILGEVAAVLCRGACHRPRHRIDAGPVRGGGDRARGAGPQAQVIGNPHNQTLNVAVQWGAVGVVVLYAMWFSHFSLFRGEGLAAWIGLMVVLQNMFSSLFNSHCSIFTRDGCMCSVSGSPEAWCCVRGRGGWGIFRNRPAMIAGMRAADKIISGLGTPYANLHRFRSRPMQ